MNCERFAPRLGMSPNAGHFLCAIISNLHYCCALAEGIAVRPEHIYKILRLTEWTQLQTSAVFDGSPDDMRDGFIHLSTAAQLQGTLDKHYRQGDDLVLAEIIAGSLGDGLKYEVSRGGAEFPHLYDRLLMDKVSRHWALSPDPEGRYAIPILGG